MPCQRFESFRLRQDDRPILRGLHDRFAQRMLGVALLRRPLGTWLTVAVAVVSLLVPIALNDSQLTVYVFEADKGTVSKCSGACAAAWPPVIAKGSAVASGQAKSADLGTTTRAGGVNQGVDALECPVEFNAAVLRFLATLPD